MQKILITGGAGYIGSHIAKNLLNQGFEIVSLDNLTTGYIEPIEILRKTSDQIEFFRGDLADRDLLKKIFSLGIDSVIHLAAKTDVRESVEKPKLYHEENFKKSIVLLEEMTRAGVDKLIFSSTCAVYGEPKYSPLDENHPVCPTNPYSQSKLDFEQYLTRANNLKYIIFRFFNVAGSDPDGKIGKSTIGSEALMENIMKVALGQKPELEVYGTDFKTRDGTAVRDYVHVEDVSAGIIAGLKEIDRFKKEIFNLGSASGLSVKDVIESAQKIIGKKLAVKYIPSRQGDLAESVASYEKAKIHLGWEPHLSTIDSMIKTDWAWRSKHPEGYQS